MPVCPVCLLVEWRLAPLAIQAKLPAKVISATLVLAFGDGDRVAGWLTGTSGISGIFSRFESPAQQEYAPQRENMANSFGRHAS